MSKIIINEPDKKIMLGDLYGLFFEDLNHAADGGLYAELIQNRSFEFQEIDHPEYHALTAWEKAEECSETIDIGKAKADTAKANSTNTESTKADRAKDDDTSTDDTATAQVIWKIETAAPVSEKNPHYVTLTITEDGAGNGIRNTGFTPGIALKKDASYRFSFYAKREKDHSQPVIAVLEGQDKKQYASVELCVTGSEWELYSGILTSAEEDPAARFAIYVRGTGEVSFDFVSLFPTDTYRGRENGLRKDIAEMLASMKPKFLRFPGGCLVHDGSLDPDARNSMYRWKNTIGPLWDRPARRNNWRYNQTLGLGYFEYFQFCEDIGTKPLPVLPAAYDPHHKRLEPLDQLQPWIDDALDLIEFANGDVTTKWGAVRASLGHPKPFGLEYVGIGNEEVGEGFRERFPYFCKAIKEKYPEIKIIGTSGPFAAGGEFDTEWAQARKEDVALVDEHYYMAPEWFLAHHHRYDDYPRKGPKVFLGEYASWGNEYYNALIEASYMTGLERNAEAVGLACYAPMLCNVNYINWQPDMIWFNNHEVYGTANYYVQKLFMHHQGDWLYDTTMEDFEEPKTLDKPVSGAICLSSRGSVAEYSNILLRNNITQEEISFEDVKSSASGAGCNLTENDWEHYTLSFHAKELEGIQGFLIEFAKKDDWNRYCLELGGWQNQDATLQEFVNGRNICLIHELFEVEKDREYAIELTVDGYALSAKIDGKPVISTKVKPVVIEPLYCTASRDESTQETILKVVNVQKESVTTTLDLSGILRRDTKDISANADSINNQKVSGMLYELSGYELNEKNSFEQPERIKPAEQEVEFDDAIFSYEFAKESITIFRLK